MCNSPARWSAGDAFSDNFRPVRQQNYLFPFGGDALCASCCWSAKTLRLRCAAWIARPDGIWWVGKRELLAALMDPPEPPFVVCLPLYGIAHGGEVHGWRATLDGSFTPDVDPLIRLQSKHVAIYATVAYQREHYPLQVDDALSVMVDVALWRRCFDAAHRATKLLRDAGTGYTDTVEAVTRLIPPTRTTIAVQGQWRSVVAPLRPYVRAAWWPVFCELLPIPPAHPPAHSSAPKQTKSPRPSVAAKTAQRSLL